MSSAPSTSTSTLPVEIISDSSPGPFEGPEKLLELWFAPSEQDVAGLDYRADDSPRPDKTGLRQVQRKVWDSMLDEVQCKVLSVIEGEGVDGYLLSESSMFVWPHKLILKTCGTTTLLLGLPTLLRIASELCGLGGVYRCFYSRKTFMFPDRQRGPHKDWNQEMQFLDNLFEDSSAYTVGRMNGDHWLLYLTPPSDNVLLPNALSSASNVGPAQPTTALADLSHSLATAPKLKSTASSVSVPRSLALPPPTQSRPDQTLEILMTRLSPAACASFYHPASPFPYSTGANPPKESYTSPLYPTDAGDADAHALGTQLADRLGLNALIPGATNDAFLFSPCGYSSNTVLGDRYATIHVTPEPDYSYASFETNVDLAPVPGADASASSQSMQQLVEKVLAIFQPAKLSLTLFVSTSEEDSEGRHNTTHQQMRGLFSDELAAKYERVDRIVYEFDGYSLVYFVFEEKDAPRAVNAVGSH